MRSKKPFAFPRMCKFKPCSNKTRDRSGYCEEHQREEQPKRKPKASHKLYNDRKWRAYSAQYRMAHPLCINFERCGRIAEVVDHIIPVERGGSFWDEANHQPMCSRCHNRKSSRESLAYLTAAFLFLSDLIANNF